MCSDNDVFKSSTSSHLFSSSYLSSLLPNDCNKDDNGDDNVDNVVDAGGDEDIDKVQLLITNLLIQKMNGNLIA